MPGLLTTGTRRTLLSAVLFLAGVVLLDQFIGLAADRLYRTVRVGVVGQINNAVAHRDAQVIAFGSSRCARHFDPVVMGKALELSVFNAGANGQGIAYASLLQSLLLHHETRARIFLLQVDVPGFSGTRNLGRLSVFAPHLDEDPLIRQRLQELGRFAGIKLASRAARYNSMIIQLLGNRITGRRPWVSGHQPLEGSLDPTVDRPVPDLWTSREITDISPAQLGLLREFVRRGVRSGVEVVAVAGPHYWGEHAAPVYRDEVLAEIRRHTRAAGGRFVWIDERRYPELRDASLYWDMSHLNREGAAVFSARLADVLGGMTPELRPTAIPREATQR